MKAKALNETKSVQPQIKKRKVKYLIIGGGTAGYSAIQAIKEADPEAQVNYRN